MDLRDGKYISPSTPAAQAFFDKNTPTTAGVVFDPDIPATADTLYVSSTNGSTWIYQDGAYVTYTAPTVNNTEWYIKGTTIDAGGNKTSSIQRSGSVTIDGTFTNFWGHTVLNRGTTGANGLYVAINGSTSGVPFRVDKGVFNYFTIANNGTISTKNYALPLADGTANQFLKTNGSGVTSWGTPSAGGLTYFTEAQSTASPNATVNVDSLTAIASTTDADFSIIAKGSGSILAQIPDGTITNGDKRGSNSIDFQSSRTGASRVNSGSYSFMGNGTDNKIFSGASYSVIVGGNNNYIGASNIYSFVGGGYTNKIDGTGSSVIVGGTNNYISIDYATIGGGGHNTVTGQYGIVAGGGYNTNSGFAGFLTGYSNTLSSSYGCGIGRGLTISGQYSQGFGGYHTVDSDYSNVIGNTGNTFGVKNRSVFGAVNTVTGDAQASKIILTKRTTNATATVLTVSAASTLATTQLTLQNNNSIRFKGTIIGRQSGSTNTSAWDIDGIIQRGTTAATTTLLISNVNVVQNTPAWGTPTLAANTTFGCLTVNVTGAATTNIQWTCSLDTTEVIYA